MLENTKIIIYFILILLFYYFINFELFNYRRLNEFDYYYCFFLGLLPFFIFKYAEETTNDTLYRYPVKFSLLMTALWYILYAMLIEEVILKSFSLAIFIIVEASLSILTKDNFPYKTEESELYKLNNVKYCQLLGWFNWGAMLLVVYVLYTGEWGV